MKVLIGAVLIREYIFSSKSDEESFIKNLRCDYKIHEEFEIEEGGQCFLSISTQYNNSPLLDVYQEKSDEN